MITGIVLSPAPDTVFLTGSLVLGQSAGEYVGRFRFLKDHYVNDEYILADEVRDMYTFWTPTSDVEPLDSQAVFTFYAAGPSLGAVIRTHFTTTPIAPPVTYWHQLFPNVWALTGLGITLGFNPFFDDEVTRVKDKEY